MRGKAWLALAIGVALFAVWQIERGLRSDGSPRPARSEGEPATANAPLPARNDDLEQPDTALDAPPVGRRADAQLAENLTAASGSGCRIHGHARDQDGAPLARYPVWLLERRTTEGIPDPTWMIGSESEAYVLGRGRTGEDGEYEIQNVGPGDWWVGIAQLAPPGNRETSLFLPAAPIQVQSGDVHRDVELVGYRGITIQGTVATPDGKPARGAVVEALAMKSGSKLNQTAVDEEGRFALGPLPLGRCLVRASFEHKFRPSEPLLVIAGADDVHLELQEGGHLVVTVVDKESGRLAVATLTTVLWKGRRDGGPTYAESLFPEERSTFDVGGLEAGVYDLVAHTRNPGIGIVRGLRVAADGEPREVTMRIEPAATLTLTCIRCRAELGVELYSGDSFVGFEDLQPGDARSFFVPPGQIRIHVEPVDSTGVPTPVTPNVDYWTRKGVRSIEVSAVLNEERTVELGGN
jgi:hypothetical protein